MVVNLVLTSVKQIAMKFNKSSGQENTVTNLERKHSTADFNALHFDFGINMRSTLVDFNIKLVEVHLIYIQGI